MFWQLQLLMSFRVCSSRCRDSVGIDRRFAAGQRAGRWPLTSAVPGTPVQPSLTFPPRRPRSRRSLGEHVDLPSATSSVRRRGNSGPTERTACSALNGAPRVWVNGAAADQVEAGFRLVVGHPTSMARPSFCRLFLLTSNQSDRCCLSATLRLNRRRAGSLHAWRKSRLFSSVAWNARATPSLAHSDPDCPDKCGASTGMNTLR